MPRMLEDSSQYELWENATDSTLWLKRFGRQGEIVNEKVQGRKKVHLKPEERRLNQEIAAEDTLDFFKNGMLMPVKLIESAEDVDELQSNPNHLSETEMVELLSNTRAVKAFNDRVNSISNPITLRRFLEIAGQEETNATVRQLKVLEARLDEVDPALFTEVQTMAGFGGREAIGTKAPKARRTGANANFADRG